MQIYKKHQTFEVIEHKFDEDAHYIKNQYKLFLIKASIKGPDTMGNPVWVRTYLLSGYVMYNSVGIVVRNTQVFHTSLCVFAPQLASMQ